MRIFLLFFCLLFQILKSQSLSEQKDYINKYKHLAMQSMADHKIPASIKMAQALLESSAGGSELSKKSNNHFGIKCKSSWDGERVYHDDDEEDECFRKYSDIEDSFRDHSYFLTTNQRYNFLFDLAADGYKEWAFGLKKAGYATNKRYSHKLIKLIEMHKLYELDDLVMDSPNDFMDDLTMKRTIFIHPNRIKFILAKKGDSLENISRDLSMNIDNILDYNDLSYESKIEQNDIIFLQSKRKIGLNEYYIAKKGDTMLTISQKSGIRLSYLYRYNQNLKTNSKIKPGQKILLR